MHLHCNLHKHAVKYKRAIFINLVSRFNKHFASRLEKYILYNLDVYVYALCVDGTVHSTNTTIQMVRFKLKSLWYAVLQFKWKSERKRKKKRTVLCAIYFPSAIIYEAKVQKKIRRTNQNEQNRTEHVLINSFCKFRSTEWERGGAPKWQMKAKCDLKIHANDKKGNEERENERNVVHTVVAPVDKHELLFHKMHFSFCSLFHFEFRLPLISSTRLASLSFRSTNFLCVCCTLICSLMS